MGTVRFLQLSWFVAAFTIVSERPVHAPTPFPEAICAATLAVPVTEKSACVHGGFAALGWTLKGVTDAVTAVMNTLPELGLSKFPDNATLPPGKRPVGATVWLTVTVALVPVLAV